MVPQVHVGSVSALRPLSLSAARWSGSTSLGDAPNIIKKHTKKKKTKPRQQPESLNSSPGTQLFCRLVEKTNVPQIKQNEKKISLYYLLELQFFIFRSLKKKQKQQPPNYQLKETLQDKISFHFSHMHFAIF